MGQVTEAFAALMLERAREGRLTPLTAWEQAQFASAWLKLNSSAASSYKCVWPNCACDHPSKKCENAK